MARLPDLPEIGALLITMNMVSSSLPILRVESSSYTVGRGRDSISWRPWDEKQALRFKRIRGTKM
jgi:hypothetical protein